MTVHVYVLAEYDAGFVIDADGKVSFTDGLPIIDFSVVSAAQTLLAGLVTDTESIYAPAAGSSLTLLPATVTDADAVYAATIANLLQFLLPGTVTDADAIYAPIVAGFALERVLRPALLTDPESVYPAYSIAAIAPGKDQKLHAPRLNSDDVIFAARFPLTPTTVVLDLDTVFAPDVFASYGLGGAPLIVAADAIYSPFVAMLAQPVMVNDTEAVYRPTISLFLLPALLDDVDAVPAADVGWQVIATFTDDADALFVPVEMKSYNDVLPDVFIEEDVIDTYPFFIQGVTGGTPVPPAESEAAGGALTGSLSNQRVLTGSLSNQTRLAGSVTNRRRTGTR